MVSAVTAEEELNPSGGAGIPYPSSAGGSRSPLLLKVTTDEIRLGCVECLCRWLGEDLRNAHITGVGIKSSPGLVSYVCLPLLPQLACSIHAT